MERDKIRELGEQNEVPQQRVLKLSTANFNYNTGNDAGSVGSYTFAGDDVSDLYA
jgi:hypothetical protein